MITMMGYNNCIMIERLRLAYIRYNIIPRGGCQSGRFGGRAAAPRRPPKTPPPLCEQKLVGSIRLCVSNTLPCVSNTLGGESDTLELRRETSSLRTKAGPRGHPKRPPPLCERGGPVTNDGLNGVASKLKLLARQKLIKERLLYNSLRTIVFT